MTTTLLAVDDSKTIRRVLEITFAGENYRTVLAESADDALSKLRAERPAVALVDASLGAASGYDLCQQIKRETPGVAVILLSSKQAPYDRTRGSSAGADDFIDKPFDTQQLIDKVSAAARKASEAAARPVAPAPAATTGPTAPSPAFAARPRANTLAYGSGSDVAAPPAQRPVVPQSATLAGGIGAPAPAFGARPGAFPSPAGPASSAQTGSAGAASAARPAHPEPSPAAPAVAGGMVPSQTAPTAVSAATNSDGQFAQRLSGLGLTEAQIQGVLSLSREVVEKVVWEVVPVLAETLIKEELRRLTSE